MPIKKNLYQEYRCYCNTPLNCDRPLQTVIDTPEAKHLPVKYCTGCGFPAIIAQNTEIKGNRIYKVTSFLGTRGLGRMYSGVRIDNNQPVVIREYLLPNRSFNDEETRQRKEKFQRVAGVSLADGRNQNFRLINAVEAIKDERGERCYLIIQEVDVSQTLRQYLQENGAMEASQVREVLNQALQTLQFLHTQKLRLPANQIQQGMAHGNISLDSILIKLEKNQNHQSNQQFYIYFCDLAIYESLFEHPTVQASQAKPEEDLIALGLAAFYLCLGRDIDSNSGQPLNPKDDRLWSNTDSHLKLFLHQLIGLDTPFESAEIARKALLQLPKPSQSNSFTTSQQEEKQEKGWNKTWFVFWGILALILLGGGMWYFLRPKYPSLKRENPLWSRLVPNFSDVPNLPPREFTYTAEKNSTWGFILRQKPQTTKLVEETLTKVSNTTFNYQAVQSPDVRVRSLPLDTVRECTIQSCKAYFAITSFPAEDGGLKSQAIASDGLLIYVAHSKKDSNLPQLLKGKISLDSLRKIYTGQITNWKDVDKNLPDLPIKPYAPTEPEAVLLFQKRVLNDDPQSIANYKTVTTQYTQATEETTKVIRAQFDENQAGIIAFGIIGKVWNQCNAYPLAISDSDNKGNAIQPLFKPEGQPIDPDIDLCIKRNYYIDESNFQRYPLGNQLFVVYPKDNSLPPGGSAFCKLLITREGQSLLQKAGLVPLLSLPENACQ
ncbi:substrate-binding domain-containing protein [Brunnivagina elsteri]|uniref:Serine/threonine protein kinase n=1 Tax=Brunnivagina elsteri CCALA 953 TaxID=987040 RepID=A0A2A2TNQ7_9CYAN|nr:substrate-binding domain-containing protein [Calothrix elsteri]PAX60083.1 serine/threonine protein kinase [Calothrix elsteri CCALA 953]